MTHRASAGIHRLPWLHLMVAAISIAVLIGGVFAESKLDAGVDRGNASATAAATELLGATAPADGIVSGSAAVANAVAIQSFSFGPQALTVSAGTTVTWTNSDSIMHTVTATDGSFDSGVLAPGQQFSFTFSTPGTYSYHCSIHPFMTGQVVVQ